MSTSTQQAARYAADHIETGEGDEACSECDGEAERVDATGRVHACRVCNGRGLVEVSAHAYPAPTDEQLRAMSGPELQAEIAEAKRLADREYWRFSRSSSRNVRPGGPGTERYGRATRERRRRIEAYVSHATAPCHDCAGRGYDCERYPDDSEVHGTERACSTCEGKGTVPHWAALMFSKRAA